MAKRSYRGFLLPTCPLMAMVRTNFGTISLWKMSYRGFILPTCPLMVVVRTKLGSISLFSRLCGKGFIEDFHYQPPAGNKAIATYMLATHRACFAKTVYFLLQVLLPSYVQRESHRAVGDSVKIHGTRSEHAASVRHQM